MSIDGYDAWKLAAPPEPATCPECGGELLRDAGDGSLYCEECD